MITEYVSNTAVKILETSGYAGAGFLMALESMIAPVPSEAVMPFVGFLVVDGKWNLWAAIAATSIGSIVGSSLIALRGWTPWRRRPASRFRSRYLDVVTKGPKALSS